MYYTSSIKFCIVFKSVDVAINLHSLQAKDHNEYGDFTTAQGCGYMALGCNIIVIILYIIEVVLAVVVFFTIIFTS